MKDRVLFFSFIAAWLIFITATGFAQQAQNTTEGQQQMDDFSVSGYGDKGKKTWEVSGKSADISSEVIKLKNVESKLYGEQENVELTANEGKFDRKEGNMHLEKDVVITTSSGGKLKTDSLDWDRDKQVVQTKDTVNIEKENILITGQGAKGFTDLKKVNLEKDVQLEIKPEQNQAGMKDKIVVSCDGPLEVDYQKNIASFSNNVAVQTEDVLINSDQMDVYFLTKSQDKDSLKGFDSVKSQSKIDKIVAHGNVKITKGENISYSDEAEYSAVDRKIVLKGRPKLVIYSTEGVKNASFGN